VSSNSNKNILIVCQHFWPESFRINDIADFFVEKNCNVDVLCGIPNYPGGKFFEGYSIFKNRNQRKDSINIRRAFEIPRGNNSNFRIFINYISFPIASLFHIPRLLTKKYDKIFLYQLSPVMMTLTGILIGKIKKVETTIYILDLWPENLFSVLKVKNKTVRKLATKMSNWYYKKADKIIVLSERMKQHVSEIPGIDGDKITVLAQTCEKLYETNIYDKNLHKRFSDGFNIIYAGNISPAQDFKTVIAAAKKLRDDGIKDIRWIIVGDGMSKTWLEGQVDKNKLSDCFYFEGQKPIKDIPKYTEIANLLIGCLIKSELLEATIPAKVMSYIASGRPMVLAMDGEVQALINDTIKCGFAGPASGSQELYSNIKKIYNMSKSERSKMGARASDYHLKNFERNIILTKMYNFIFDLN
jgi:glycosyltransferase involved in cell wall biosynthesis